MNGKPRTLNVLSIDFDYFQKTTKHTIHTCYPDGIDLPTELSTIVWATYYENPKIYEHLKHVTILNDELQLLRQILTSDDNTQKTAPVMITNSHVHIYDFIHKCTNTFHSENINIVNIDMHHDMFNDNTELNCGNWLSHIAQDFKRHNISWICNPLSLECYGFTKDEIPKVNTSLKAITDCKFDIIFLCRSDNWFPPHLDSEFHNIVQLIQSRFKHVAIESNVKEPRNITDAVNLHKECFAKLKLQTT